MINSRNSWNNLRNFLQKLKEFSEKLKVLPTGSWRSLRKNVQKSLAYYYQTLKTIARNDNFWLFLTFGFNLNDTKNGLFSRFVRSAFNNYGTGGGRDGPRPGGNMYGERSPSHHNQHNHKYADHTPLRGFS